MESFKLDVDLDNKPADLDNPFPKMGFRERASSMERRPLKPSFTNVLWEQAHKTGLEKQVKLENLIVYMRGTLEKGGNEKSKQMTAKSMKIYMDNIIEAINSMEKHAITKEEIKKTSVFKNKATAGQLGKDYKFFEEMNLKSGRARLSHSPNVPPSKRTSLRRPSSGDFGGQGVRSNSYINSQRSNSQGQGGEETQIQIADVRRSSLLLSALTTNDQDTYENEDIYVRYFTDIRNNVRHVKVIVDQIKVMSADLRTVNVKSNLIDQWEFL